MRSDNTAGFTIIETMLFLGISGLLFVGIMVGTGTSINTQRYRDSVTSLQSTIQKQFSDVANVSNERPDGTVCGGSASSVGQSECVILGRYITSNVVNVGLSSTVPSLSIKTVVGHLNPGDSFSGDVEAFKKYNLQISPVEGDSYDIEWGSTLTAAGTNNPMKFSLLILRSPASGMIRTFINPNSVISDANIVSSLINATPSALNQSAKICVDSNGLFTGPRMAVVVDANATGPTAVEVLGDNSGC